ncbi:MAG TPA: tetratricopeptide repeat protein [Candidatus Xenobia bacterium]|nr:tetratricopeptide repeat protein [Candidatus Xenobia bacterium]
MAADTVLVIPFENVTRAADLEWVGESFAEALSEHLQADERTPVTREERLAALEHLGLPVSGPLSHASVIRLGEEVGADWVVAGHFRVQSGQLRTQAWVFDLSAQSLSEPVEDVDAFEHLLDAQARVAWRVLRQRDPVFPLSLISFQQRRPRIPISAFESYIRGLLATDRDQQLRYFLSAARLEPAYAPPAFRAALLYYADGDYASATRWFRQASTDRRLGPQANFYLGLSHYASNDYRQAAEALQAAAAQAPSAGVWNNLGVVTSRQDDPAAETYFARALQLDPNDASIHFNLGLHYVRRGEWELALRALDRCLAANPRDTEAHFLRSYTLRHLGRLEEAERARNQAIGDNPALALSLERRRFELDRLRTEFRPRELSREVTER